jgi:hypothetical protein
VTCASIFSVTLSAFGYRGYHFDTVSFRLSFPSSRSWSITVVRYGIAIEPIRQCMSRVAGTSVIVCPSAAVTTGRRPRCTRTIAAWRWFSRMTWRVIRMTCSASRSRRWAAAGGASATARRIASAVPTPIRVPVFVI